jgi:hypothetical protein
LAQNPPATFDTGIEAARFHLRRPQQSFFSSFRGTSSLAPWIQSFARLPLLPGGIDFFLVNQFVAEVLSLPLELSLESLRTFGASLRSD